jgi:hypothetical protein
LKTEYQITDDLIEGSVVRFNLMNREYYQPYCGVSRCFNRATFNKNKKQFECTCGWISQYPESFIEKYLERWGFK